MTLHALRIPQGQDLRLAIADFVAKEKLTACVIACAVGGLERVRLRMAGATHTDDGIRIFEGPFEIVSLIGIPHDTMHLHLSVSDKKGRVIGGHVKEGCIVAITVELVIISDEQLSFTREVNPATGFNELQIHKRLRSSSEQT